MSAPKYGMKHSTIRYFQQQATGLHFTHGKGYALAAYRSSLTADLRRAEHRYGHHTQTAREVHRTIGHAVIEFAAISPAHLRNFLQGA